MMLKRDANSRQDPMRNAFPWLDAFNFDPLQATVDYYAGCLSEKSLAWIETNLHLSKEQAAKAKIGFSDRSLGNQLPRNTVVAGRTIRDRLVELGLYKANGRETLRGYVTIPLFDTQGNLSGVDGMRLDPKAQIPEQVMVGTGVRSQVSSVGLQASGVGLQEKHVNHVPDSKNDEPATLVTPHSITITRGDRSYIIRGLERNMSSLTLKISIAASRLGNLHLDTVDLMRSASRQAFARAAASELYVEEETIKKDLGWLLLQLEDLRNLQIDAAKALKGSPVVKLSDAQRNQAMALLTDPNLVHRVVTDLDQCGMVGEAFNKLAAYLAVVSRKLSNPLAILIQSSSSAGKTTLMDGILNLFPQEDYLRLSNLTSQSLYYLDSGSIRHKTLAISEDHGLAEAAYALKLLQSEGRLSHATVCKGTDGAMHTQLQQVEGPVQLMLTSTSKDIDEELANRCLILTVDESREQTLAIQDRQRLLQTRAGQTSQAKTRSLMELHQNAQRLLRPLRVYNNMVDQLQFPSDRTRNRRDHQKFLTLIQAIALLHQHQRITTIDDDGTESIEVQRCDIELAERLMKQLLSQSVDELPPQTKRCLAVMEHFVLEQCRKQALTKREFRFSRRAFRESSGWSDYQVRTHLQRLVSLEYILVHRGKQGSNYVYELC